MDEELGVDSAAEAEETKRQREEEENQREHPDPKEWLAEQVSVIEAITERLDGLAPQMAADLVAENPYVLKRFEGVIAELQRVFQDQFAPATPKIVEPKLKPVS